MGHWANFQGAGEQIESTDTDGKQGNWDLVVKSICSFPVSNCNILTYYEQNILSTHVQSCLGQIVLTAWMRTFSVTSRMAGFTHTHQDGTGGQAVSIPADVAFSC